MAVTIKGTRCYNAQEDDKVRLGAGSAWRGWGAVLIYTVVQALSGHRGRTQDTLVQGKACTVAWRQRQETPVWSKGLLALGE